MRYVGIIAVVDWLVLAGALQLLYRQNLDFESALLASAFACVISVPIALIVGFPALWVSRRIAPGDFAPLAIMGSGLGGLLTWFLLPFPDRYFVTLGFSLGFLSATLWWLMVERKPEGRAYYD